ncbi:helix-turn-helix transcriptional regulator [Streptomyces sp. AV19]|uniref:helix-turn-helix domain-containing protein n=1 Tax=Streptomyces sp. AV19 TaxID=2793068 RepID=UPI0018FE7F92|nr:helix-turn-helix transcriptional regulator [Streptomyces sp. AV19]MBH1935769.1 helix-turn-helix transcriptional regulator [Streptomyces sp. AV19]MDG4535957.1 helix-turn-helix transcriptional regulator [Streptomyces sp. AV19]
MPARTELTPDRSVRHLFGARLQRHREHAGLSLERLALIVNSSKSALSRLEHAEVMPDEELPAKLDAAFGTGEDFQELYVLMVKEIHPDQFKRLMAMEARAKRVRGLGAQIIPGLLQTEDYSRAQFQVHSPKAPPERIDELVIGRMHRQATLRRKPNADLAWVLDEACLRRLYGTPDVARAQLERLAQLTCTNSTTIQVLPFSAGPHGLLGGTLTLLTLEDGTEVAYEEAITTGTLLEDQASCDEYRRTYHQLSACALSPSDSADVIRSVMEAIPQ